MKRAVTVVVVIFAVLAGVWWLSVEREKGSGSKKESIARSELQAKVAEPPTAAELLLERYGDAGSEPIEDVRKLHRVVSGYFSTIKDPYRFPIGGNEDLAAALRGENANGDVFLRKDHPVFSREGLLVDRWGTPLIVHPEGWKQISLRSAGPDRKGYNGDDLVITPQGVRGEP